MMKKLAIYLFMLVLLIACGGGDDAGGGGSTTGGSEYLNVNNNKTTLDVHSDETTAKLVINASPGCEWAITWDQSQNWIRNINPINGRGSETVTILLNPNTSMKENSTVLTIRNTNGNIQPRTVTLRQLAGAAYLELNIEGNRISFPSTGGEQKVSVSSNTSWKIEGFPAWLNVNPVEGEGNDVVTITTTHNTTKDEQTATLSFRPSGGSLVQINVTQAAASLPIIQLPQVTDITKTEASVSFSFESELLVTTCGVCYSLKDDENLDNHPYVSQGWSASQGNPVIQLSGLAAGTTYYVHAYAVSAVGRQYSEKVTFKTLSSWPGIDDNKRP